MVEKWGIPFIFDHRPLHLLIKVLSLRNEPSHFAVSSNQVTSVPYPLLLAAGDFFPLLPEIQLCILSVTRCAPLLSGESTRSGYFTLAVLQALCVCVWVWVWCSFAHYMLPVELWCSTWLEHPGVLPVSRQSLWRLYPCHPQILVISIFNARFLSFLLQ